MSSDDEEFAYAVIERAEKFMASKVAKVRKDLLDYKADADKRINALEEEVTYLKRVQTGNEQTMADLRNENEQHRQQIESVAAERLESTFQPARMIENAFRAGLSSVMGERTTSIDITPVLDAIGATPITSTPMPERTCQLMTNILKRRNPLEESPSAFTRLEDVPESTRRALEPYYMVDGQANKDKLNNVQRAFIKLKTNELVRDKTPQ